MYTLCYKAISGDRVYKHFNTPRELVQFLTKSYVVSVIYISDALHIMTIADRCKEIVNEAVRDLGNDLQGHSVIDLCADNIERVSISDIKSALVVAGVDNLLSERLVKSYSR